MRSVGPSMGSPRFTRRDLFSISINAKIRLESRQDGRSGGGAGEWKVTVETDSFPLPGPLAPPGHLPATHPRVPCYLTLLFHFRAPYWEDLGI